MIKTIYFKTFIYFSNVQMRIKELSYECREFSIIAIFFIIRVILQKNQLQFRMTP